MQQLLIIAGKLIYFYFTIYELCEIYLGIIFKLYFLWPAVYTRLVVAIFSDLA